MNKFSLNWRLYLLLVIFLIYGLFSSPTPDDPGIWEALIGCLLIMISAYGFIIAMTGGLCRRGLYIPVSASLSFVWMLIIPTITGVLVRGNDIGDCIRDIIPLFYLMLPVLLYEEIKKNPYGWKVVIQWGLSFVGIVYVIRFFLTNPLDEIFKTSFFGDMNYFQQDPAVIFAATFLIISGINLFFSRSLVRASLLLLSGFFVYSSMLAGTMRGQIGLVLATLIIVVLSRIWRFPFSLNTWIPVTVFVFCIILSNSITDVTSWTLDSITRKTETTGLTNNRILEIEEVLDHVLSNWDLFLFGDGWGAKLYTSTNAGEVRFTHDLISYLIWKTGVLGMIFYVGTSVLFMRHLFFILQVSFSNTNMLPLFWGSVNALIVYGMIEPGFKMLTFGFVLCLILAASYASINQAVPIAANINRYRSVRR